MPRTPTKTKDLTPERVIAALDEYDSNEQAAVKGLNMARMTLEKWLKKNNLKPEHRHVLVPIDKEQSTD